MIAILKYLTIGAAFVALVAVIAYCVAWIALFLMDQGVGTTDSVARLGASVMTLCCLLFSDTPKVPYA